jgi:hypothetical protein
MTAPTNIELMPVVLESPYAASTNYTIEENVAYAKLCLLDSLAHGESPIASHMLWTQPGLLSDDQPSERWLGLSAGHAWIEKAHQLVVYTDHGISPGMDDAITLAKSLLVPVVYRSLGDTP